MRPCDSVSSSPRLRADSWQIAGLYSRLMGTSRVFTGLQVGEFDDTQPIPKAFKVRHPEPFRLAAWPPAWPPA